MSKFIYIATIILYDFLLGLMADDLGITTVGEVLPDIPTDINIFTAIIDAIDTFTDLLSFNITDGFPNVLVIIFVYVPNIILFFILIGLIFNRD